MTTSDNMQPNAALVRFHHQVCPDLDINSPEIVFRLIEEINELRKDDINERLRKKR
ncbi:MAG: hypothetical protein KAW45_02410 [Thermoplasmatales archaeon]|nr:hypothetical protein [Thermoplasmatales archaeon]